MTCGKSVSTPVPTDTIVRAHVECPECIEVGPLAVMDHERGDDRAAIRALVNGIKEIEDHLRNSRLAPFTQTEILVLLEQTRLRFSDVPAIARARSEG